MEGRRDPIFGKNLKPPGTADDHQKDPDETWNDSKREALSEGEFARGFIGSAGLGHPLDCNDRRGWS